jgi:hypothetical protein
VAYQPSEPRSPHRLLVAGLVTNEFASVRVEIDHTRNSPVLHLTDTETGDAIWLDAVELQTILRSDPAAFIAYPPGWPGTREHSRAGREQRGELDEGTTTPCLITQYPITQ